MCCKKSFASNRRLGRHRNTKTKSKLQTNQFIVIIATSNHHRSSKWSNIEKNLHRSETIQHCVYCSKSFLMKPVVEDHLKLNHGTPPWRNDGYTCYLPAMISIGGNLRSIQLHTSGIQTDMLLYIIDQKPEIQQIVGSENEAGPKKIQFAAKMKNAERRIRNRRTKTIFNFFANFRNDPRMPWWKSNIWKVLEQIINSISTITTNRKSGWRFGNFSHLKLNCQIS